MANLEDVELFLRGVTEWNDAAEDWQGETLPHRSWRFRRDLSDAQLGMQLLQRVNREENFFLEQATSYPRIDFCSCDLRRTDFSIMSVGFDFRKAGFISANLQEARLTAADLTDATFLNSDLENAILAGATLDGTRFGDANLTGTDLSATRPWRAQLFQNVIPKPSNFAVRKTSIESVADLIAVCSELGIGNRQDGDNLRLYYRGQARSWKLRPSVMRARRFRNQEGRMLLDLMTRRPKEFGEMKSALSQWVLAQHHGLKTRLLDVTRNPLVAMFNICEDKSFAREDGQLHIFSVPSSIIRNYQSDVVSVIANFAKLSYSEQTVLLGKRRGIRHPYREVLGKLYHLIGEEKPHFQRRIDPRDLFRVFLVEPQQSIERLTIQSGAFLLSAFHERFERNSILRWNRNIPTYDHLILRIPSNCKSRILSELALMNVTRETLFPGLDESANSINHKARVAPPVGQEFGSENRTWKEERIFVELPRCEIPPTKWEIEMKKVVEETKGLNPFTEETVEEKRDKGAKGKT